MGATQKATVLQCTQKDSIIRPLGYMELYQSALYVVGQYVGTMLTCRYTLPKNLTLNHDTLVATFELAIARALLENPILLAGILNEDSRSPSWVELEKVDFANHVHWRVVPSTEDYAAALHDKQESELDAKYLDSETQPGWRMTILRPEDGDFIDVVFVWHHAHIDGMGGRMIHETILHHLNSATLPTLDSAEASAIIKDRVMSVKGRTRERFVPPQEQIAKYPVSLPYAIITAWHALRPKYLEPDNPKQATWAPIRKTPYKTHLRSVSLHSDALAILLRKCREKSTTITGLLHAATLTSIASRLDLKHASAFSSITARNMRPDSFPSPQAYPWLNTEKMIGVNVSSHPHSFETNLVADLRSKLKDLATNVDGAGEGMEEMIWTVASDIRAEIRKFLDQGPRNNAVGLMWLVRDWRTLHNDLGKKARAHSWVVTNIGVLDGDPAPAEGSAPANTDERWRITRSQFSVSAEVSGPAIHVSSVTVRGGDFVADVSWQEGVVSNELGDMITKDLQHWLSELAR